MPLRDVYAGLHSWMLEHGVPCITREAQAAGAEEIDRMLRLADEALT